MIPYHLKDEESCKKLVQICEKYKDDFNVDVLLGRQTIDGRSILGVFALAGNIVSLNVSNKDSEAYKEFRNEIKKIGGME